jgi:DNA (cytosine-5)-methyltransferase 1
LSTKQPLKFIDLFAGIGGFHYAFHQSPVNAECVFVSEWDEAARRTYEHTFKALSPRLFDELKNDQGVSIQPRFAGDITKVNYEDIEDFDVLCGGFPCQPFSHAGKRLGMEEARGTLFFNILEILRVKRPAAYFLENVVGLLNHQSGDKSTISIVEQNLRALGYSFELFKVKASDYGVPQLRPRVFMIGFRDPQAAAAFVAPAKKELAFTMNDVFGGQVNREVGYTLRVGGRHSGLADRRNWDTYLVDGEVRRLSSVEGKKMQGFPPEFRFPESVSETQAMKQLGNSVAVPAIKAFAEEIAKALGQE